MKIILDEPQHRIEVVDGVVHVMSPGIGRDDDSGHPRAETDHIETGRRDVIVEATEVVPGEKDGGVTPVTAFHHRIDYRLAPGLSDADSPRRVVTVLGV